MNYAEIQQVLSNYKPGTYIKVCWESDITSSRARKNGITIIKKCEALVRTAISYRNIKGVTPSNNDSWESWFEHSTTRGVVQHKKDADMKYLQLYPVKGKKIKTTIVATVETDDLTDLYNLGLITKASLPKDTLDDSSVKVMTLSVDKITRLGK